MTEFTVRIADRTILVHALFESTREFCRNYLAQGAPDFSVTIVPEDIAWERTASEEQDKLEGLPVYNYPDWYLETLALQRKTAEALFAYDTLLFHGSVVAVDGVCYLFTAKSGTGKSTHTRLWREMLGSRAVMVNDDKPFLRVAGDQVTAYGSPWNGKHHLGENIAVPLKAICLLERGEENRIRPIPAADAVDALLQQSHRPHDRRMMLKYLELLDGLSAQVEFYRLACNMDPEAAKVSYEAMSRKDTI